MEGVAAVDGGHVARVVEEVGADGAQCTDRHDHWTQRAQAVEETAKDPASWPRPRASAPSNLALQLDFRGRTGSDSAKRGGGT